MEFNLEPGFFEKAEERREGVEGTRQASTISGMKLPSEILGSCFHFGFLHSQEC